MSIEVDPLRDYAWIGVAAVALFFAIAAVVAAVDGGRRISQPTLQFLLAHVIFVPLAVGLTVWCYQHPERLDNNPDAVFDDMRRYWPFFALFDIALIAFFIRSRWCSWGARALRLMERANRLLAEGKVEEADAAYAEGRWILEHKCKQR